MAELKYGLISVDDHVQEHPEVWTKRLSRPGGVTGCRISNSSLMAQNTGWLMARNCRLPGRH